MEPLSEQQILKNLRQQQDCSAQYYAAWWLGKKRSRHPDALPLLLQCLAYLKQNGTHADQRGVALNAIRALGLLQDDAASDALIQLLQSDDYTVREEAARSLGSIRAEAAIQPICNRLSSGIEQAGAEQNGSPRLREPCEALLEALGDIGLNTAQVTTTLHPFQHHPRPLVRAAACRALLQLTQEAHFGEELIRLLQHPEPLVRRGALLDLGATGWTGALPAIQDASVEASLKLVALRGLAESSDDSTVLDAMDSLL
ncbi:phycoerythrobilin Cys-84 alpha-phycocyanin lyase/ RpcE subunit [Synechococcus sp. A18-25c]|uniref:HEAT repeat domain-containing protein n=1 Tax=unclassified Synechococcus TaxID=2626047 RepID=UPI000C390E62|nr:MULTISPECIES: HEAT repeat domain-containing protein [unclassified Synechococcus]MAN19927.1 glycosyl transferase family 2 [Synechococcus sp. EAC657]QNI47200.1 phycoerythrobilin Cys-84 alpha-phycocyanin lyase/ RpcE subunit [Synechococcus sp. A15-60]QNJ18820.1 phycoerythrobilin Cys-84 alpha-phycocyanin lyase/ RpcE subunit [Synechococcus sp. A18-25c]